MRPALAFEGYRCAAANFGFRMQRIIELIERGSNRLKARFRAVWRAISDPPLRPKDYVIFSKGLYFRIPKEQIHVVSWGKGDSVGYAMTIGEARNLISQIREAYRANELRKTKIGAATWTIDC